MTLVVDASFVVAALTDSGPDGSWAATLLGSTDRVAAPHLMPVESANVLRRAAVAGNISQDVASMAHSDLMDLTVDLYSYEPFGARVWELRASVNPYDAWYVALAEALEVELATLDRRLARAPSVGCAFQLPPERSTNVDR